MSTTFEEFQEKFETDRLLIARSAHWTWSARAKHTTLGAGVLSLNRYCTAFSDITPEEAIDLAVISKTIETKVKQAFKAETFNYLMLMMVDAHLHYHVIPRYSGPREFAGRTWTDSGWPALPALKDSPDLSEDHALIAIIKALKST